jgi:hypothetical protein
VKAIETVKCVNCGKEIEDCAFCEEPACKKPTCENCLGLSLVERISQLHDYGDR